MKILIKTLKFIGAAFVEGAKFMGCVILMIAFATIMIGCLLFLPVFLFSINIILGIVGSILIYGIAMKALDNM